MMSQVWLLYIALENQLHTLLNLTDTDRQPHRAGELACVDAHVRACRPTRAVYTPVNLSLKQQTTERNSS